jgi:PAS domain S-box-containing protein
MPDTLDSILDTHPDLIFRIDTDWVFTYANKATAEFFHRSQQNVMGTSLKDRSRPEEIDIINAHMALLTPKSPSITSPKLIDHPDGTSYLLWTIIAIFDDHGELQGYQAVSRNVTHEERLKRQLEAKRQELNSLQIELRSVLDTVPSLIWYKDDKNKILRLNQAAAQSMGMAVEDVEGQNTYDLFGEAAKDYHLADLSVFESGEPIRGMIEPYTPDSGEQGWVQTDKIPFSDGNDGPRILVVSTDITELKEQEAILKSINKNLDDFASLTSHDLQAPLRKIGISAQLMQMELGDKLPEETNAYFEDIAQGVNHMRNLIQSFLKFMRASPDGVDLGSVDLTKLLGRIAEEEHGALTSVGGSLTLPDKDIRVRGDAALLGQVFSNLVNNAVKYRSTERPVSIDISAKIEKQYWVISVTDNGSGIDPSFAKQVFDLFGRAKPHMDIEGSGIGLALCRRIITLHGGTIELIDTKSPGSRFQVKLFRARRSGIG